jgi:NAD(P)-dependent dehydrogenase (short-subunit alcohol dehydrogenase family)
MDVTGKHVIVTGAASGIGRALARRFAGEGARAVVVADVDGAGAQTVADGIGGLAVPTDVSRESDIQQLVARAEEANGAVDLFCSNAGIAGPGGGPEAPDDGWERIWHVNVMAHVWVARALLPRMLARGDGYLLFTASAAGLLTQVSALPYSVTKHATVALAEWISIVHGDAGIKVSCLCPQAVQTPMLEAAREDSAGMATMAAAGTIQPEEVAGAVVEGLRAERFLILPHPEVADYVVRKATDPDRWIASMRRFIRTSNPNSG